ncbi:hypothetical protein CLV33_106206 [Jejuia pallidilutea]|uniref:Lipoprotein n=1 Tax=Jejuia pallidilutea TaxID=504487 RepID=A0A362X8L2_9FLAO|nr:hypothetical protein [Jejuia pallidilutea]PQV47886.1 hypothetical protein CLV33_106206 [Jejuia pallidilutea]
MKIKIIYFLIIGILLSGCVSKSKYEQSQNALDSCNKELSIVLEKQKEIEKEIELLDNRDLCESNEAVYRGESKYKNQRKFAKITLKVPKESQSTSRQSIEGNVITYITYINEFNAKWKKYKDQIDFDEVYDSITIIHIINYDVNQRCPDLLGEKHKTSVIQGTHPFIPDED